MPQLSVGFSYETPVAFSGPASPVPSFRWRVVENQWGPTTGKHLAWFDPEKNNRVPYDQFAEELAYAMGRRVLANGEVVWRQY